MLSSKVDSEGSCCIRGHFALFWAINILIGLVYSLRRIFDCRAPSTRQNPYLSRGWLWDATVYCRRCVPSQYDRSHKPCQMLAKGREPATKNNDLVFILYSVVSCLVI